MPGGSRRRRGPRSYAGAVDLDALAETKLADADGVMHRLGDTWRDRPIVLVFLRHFG